MDPIHGRGSSVNIPNRFEEVQLEPTFEHLEYEEDLAASPQTKFFRDATKTILTKNASPDIGFNFSVNPYRGCEHGCSYCYARPTHEYLGMSAGLDFETKIFVKENAAKLLDERLYAPSWEPESIVFSGVTDCYQPAERHFQLTRQCLEVLLKFKNPAFIITKNALVTRDIDFFKEFLKFKGISVLLSVTTLDADLCGKMEPRTSRPNARLKAIGELANIGVNVGVNVAPVIPGLTDHELPQILKAAAEHGASFAGYTPLRLPFAVAPLFSQWLEQHFPDRKEKVLSHIRSLRGGKLNDPNFGSRMRGEGAFAKNLNQMFKIYCRKYGLNEKKYSADVTQFQRPPRIGDQLSL
jgi:DNA repair photolyase